MLTARRKALPQVTAMTLTLLLASACTGATPSSPHPTTSRATGASSPSSTPSSTAEAGPATASPSPTAAAAPPLCDTADLAVTVTTGEGAAGSNYSDLVLTNNSDHTCSTLGYAGVSYVDHEGAQVGAPATRASGRPVTRVVLTPGKRATATLVETHAENYSEAQCRPAPAEGLRVYPPDQTESVVVRHAALACAAPDVHLLSVAAFR